MNLSKEYNKQNDQYVKWHLVDPSIGCQSLLDSAAQYDKKVIEIGTVRIPNSNQLWEVLMLVIVVHKDWEYNKDRGLYVSAGTFESSGIDELLEGCVEYALEHNTAKEVKNENPDSSPVPTVSP